MPLTVSAGVYIATEKYHKKFYTSLNKTNLVYSLFFVYLYISTCFGRLCAHHQEK